MLTPILATEGAECGLASIAMVANALGHRCTLNELRQRFSISLKGATVAQLVRIGDALGLQARALRLDDAIVEFNRRIIEATVDLVACYKPNVAFYESLGFRAVAQGYRLYLD